MRRKKLGVGILAMLAAATTVAACSSSHQGSLLRAPQLVDKIIPAPYGYTVDSTPGANGGITPAVFAQYGGGGSATKLGFVAGFKANYVNSQTQEGIIVTLLEFSSVKRANAYLKQTATKTLSFASATYKPFGALPGATEADGTKVYGGEYPHAVVDAINNYYFQVDYVTAAPATPPIEFPRWVEAQWALLDVSAIQHSTTSAAG
jgi:hypothetical protein